MRKLLPGLLLALCVVVAWTGGILTSLGSSSGTAEIEAQIAEAEDLKTYKNVIDLYDKVIEAHPDDISWYERKADAYSEMEWYKSYVATCERIVKEFPNEPSGYERLMAYYDETGDYEAIYGLYARTPGELRDNPMVSGTYARYEYAFGFVSSSYDSAEPISWGNAPVGSGGSYGYVGGDGAILVDEEYDAVRPMYEDLGAVLSDGEWFVIDTEGDRVLASRDKLTDLYSPSEGFILAQVDGKYGYYDAELKDPAHVEYDEASVFYNGVAAVCSEGKWALVDTSFNQVTDFVFDAVYLDNAHVATRKGLVFAVKDGLYGLYDLKGGRIGDESFEDVRPFMDDLAAVKQDGKWGFVNESGEIAIACTFDEADSFSGGIAPAAKGEEWGFIDESGEFVIEPTFSGAGRLSRLGVAPVRSGDTFRYIRFHKFEIEET